MRAIMYKVQELGQPKHYMVDLATDAAILYQWRPTQFVISIGDCGTHLFWDERSPHAISITNNVYGPSVRWFTYDEDRVSKRASTENEPLLEEVTADEAREFARQFVIPSTENEYLTK
jgi:hypothetical protein